MDYSAFYPQQQFSTLAGANLQPAPNGFSLNSNPSNVVSRQQQQQRQQNNPMAQLQQNMFFLDPFDTKLEPIPSNDLDHASFARTQPSQPKIFGRSF
jgi:hypothetical protein